MSHVPACDRNKPHCIGLRYRGLLLIAVFAVLAVSVSLSCKPCLCHNEPGEFGSPNRVYCEDFSGLASEYITDPEPVSERETRLQLTKGLLKSMESCQTFGCVDSLVQNVTDTGLFDLREAYFEMRDQNRFDTLSESDRVRLIKCGFSTAIEAGV